MAYVSWVSDRMTYAIYRVFDMAYQHHRDGYCTLEDIRETWIRDYGEDIAEFWDAWLEEGFAE